MTEHPQRCAIITLGCPKNLVDAEAMAVVLRQAGLASTADASDADVVIVNTCGFIQAAIDESMDAIRQLARLKRPGQRLVVAGCLAERTGRTIAERVPEVDAVVGTLRWAEIADVVREASSGQVVRTGPGGPRPIVPRAASGGTAYVKISEGCDAACAFCTIPSIKGRQISRPIDELSAEVAGLVSRGVLEITLIGQDTTSYGRDLDVEDGLAALLERLCDSMPDSTWLRFMYAYPTRLSDHLLDVIASRPQIAKYLDLPLQHSHPDVLRRMRRPAVDTLALIDRVRSRVAGVAIRSTFIIGYPGEGDDEFAHLLDFARQAQLDRVGLFEYSPEPGTPAAELPDPVPTEVVADRMARFADLQRGISRRRLAALVGTTMPVLLEAPVDDPRGARASRTVGRTQRDAPEVDGLIYVREALPTPALAKARIQSHSDHDLFGTVVR